MSDSTPQKAVWIVGALSIVVGMRSIFGMVFGAIGGRIVFDLGFVGIPIGYGILIRRASSRKWAIFFSGVGTILMLGIVALMGYRHLSGIAPLHDPDAMYLTIESVGTLGVCLYVFFTLRRSTVRTWFESSTAPPDHARHWAWVIAVVAGLLLMSHHVMIWWIGVTLDDLYLFSVRVIPYDIESGEGLSSISYTSEAMSLMGSPRRTFPMVSVGMIGSPDGMEIEFTGVATQPLSVTIRSIGYDNAEIMLTKDTESEIRLGMHRLSHEHAEQDAPAGAVADGLQH